MTSNNQQNIIAPELFEYVTDYAQEVKDGSVSIYDAVDGDHSLVIFAENFLEQFSLGYLKQSITGFNERSRRQLRQRRRALESNARKNKKTKSAQQLIFHLEPFCERIPEISYGNSEIDADEFHTVYFLELLEGIVAWLKEESSDDLELNNAAQAALNLYVSAIE